jgi:hypothetical protein
VKTARWFFKKQKKGPGKQEQRGRRKQDNLIGMRLGKRTGVGKSMRERQLGGEPSNTKRY